MVMKWYGDECHVKIKELVGSRLDKAARTVRDYIREELGVVNPRARTRSRKTGRFTKGRGTQPSAPGDFPRKVMGHLRRNVQSETDRMEMRARVGTNVEYGKFLELGTSKMARRPWLTRGIVHCQALIARILNGL